MAQILDQAKAENIVILDVGKLIHVVDYFVLATCMNPRHARSSGERIREELKADKIMPIGIEGMQKPSWVLLDYATVVVHIFLEDTRRYYDLDHLFSDAARIAYAGP